MAGGKIGIFGGSFNPPHLGHRKLAVTAADALGLDRVIVMPAGIPPHKVPVAFAGAKDRVRMCELTFAGDCRFEVSTLEIDRGSRSYTVDTLGVLREQYPGDELYLITGSDMLETFKQWYKWEEILSLAYVCTAVREKSAVLDYSGFTDEQRKRFIPVEADPIEISSTQIRRMLADGGDVSAFLDGGVIEYIKENGLYEDRFPDYRRLVESKLDAERLNHSFGVSRAARKLALKYGANADKAELAGLLHDVMKNAPKEEQRRVIEAGGHKLTAVELANSKVWHAMAGEAFLRCETDIDDEEILSAVRHHTTGAAGMTLLDRIVYIADFISEERDYPDVETVRRLADESLEKAIIYTTTYTIRDLAAKGLPIHPDTVDCYNDILINMTEKEV